MRTKRGKNSHGEARRAEVATLRTIASKYPDEVIVVMESADEQLTAIFPLSSVNGTTGKVSAKVLGERKDSYLIELPAYTLTTGSRAWILKKFVTVGETH